jgi:thiol-disulfide isomerase/thioredoxin
LALVAACVMQAGAKEEPTLKVGSPAPAMQAGKWVQGEAVTSFEPGKVYVVEFWATWCGPCRRTIPHLNEVYTKFKDKGLVVIGQNCWEDEEGKVPEFVKSMGDKMTYRVALDDKTKDAKGAMATTWMDAAGRGGIPSAFVVDKQGKIAWIGHPAAGEMTAKIEELLAK